MFISKQMQCKKDALDSHIKPRFQLLSEFFLVVVVEVLSFIAEAINHELILAFWAKEEL